MADTNMLSPLGAVERAKMTRAQRLLLNITDPAFAPKAAKAGYDEEEHAEGWRLFDLAAGRTRPFHHFLGAELRRALAGGAAKAAERYHELDAFENAWFPRARNAIRRFVEATHRVAVETAFFADLQQQPEGPGVVGSVDALLKRLEGLRDSDAPGAAAAWRSLVKKGLTDEARARAAALVAEAKAAARPADDGPDEAQIRRDGEAQVAAFEALSLWFNDWADTLRPHFDYHGQVRLGLTRHKGGRAAGGNGEDGEDDGGGEGQ